MKTMVLPCEQREDSTQFNFEPFSQKIGKHIYWKEQRNTGHAKKILYFCTKKTGWTDCGRQPHDIADFLFMIFDFPGSFFKATSKI